MGLSCIAPMLLPKVKVKKGLKFTVGNSSGGDFPYYYHVECDNNKDVVVADVENLIVVTAPAFMQDNGYYPVHVNILAR
eukprot:scaffold2422_cov56-Attheya_sp.AAC.7